MTRIARLEIGSVQGAIDAMAGVRPATGDRVALRVALLPPVAQLRRIELPRMTEHEARRVVARNVARWFPDAREPQVVAVQRAGTAWIVAVAPAALVDEVYRAAAAAGVTVDAVVPAHALWAAAAGEGLVKVTGAHETTVIAASRGAIVSMRRLPPALPLPADLAHARPLPSSAVPARVGLDLVPDAVRETRTRAGTRAAWSLAGAAAAMLVLAAGLTLWGEHRELASLRARREALRPDVQIALTQRDSLVEASERTVAIASLDRSAERWSGVIARVAEALPQDASLSAFRAEADSLSLEGQARDAAGVFAAMRSTPGFLAVRASAPVRQEGGGSTGQPVIERFTMAARVGREHP
jgi:hypothetical protein